MRSIIVVLVTCLVLIFLVSCDPGDYLYVEVVVNEGSLPIFRFSTSEDFSEPADIVGIQVWDDEPDEWFIYWEILRIGDAVSLWEITYGDVPDGFTESEKAVPLEPDAKYRLKVEGKIHSFALVVLPFTYEPGRYFGSASTAD